jgi:hypothetical protein
LYSPYFPNNMFIAPQQTIQFLKSLPPTPSTRLHSYRCNVTSYLPIVMPVATTLTLMLPSRL